MQHASLDRCLGQPGERRLAKTLTTSRQTVFTIHRAPSTWGWPSVQTTDCPGSGHISPTFRTTQVGMANELRAFSRRPEHIGKAYA